MRMNSPKPTPFGLFVLALLMNFPAGFPMLSPCTSHRLYRREFSTTAVIPGVYSSVLNSSWIECGRLCSSHGNCLSFGYTHDGEICSLYTHIVQYTTKGTASPTIQYYWFLSTSCPAELGYIMEEGVCYKIYAASKNWTEAKEQCRVDKGHLFLGDAAWKRSLVLGKYAGWAWLGATDEDEEGDWRWLNGRALPVDSDEWEDNEPNNFAGRQHYLMMTDLGKLADGMLQSQSPFICEVPVAV